MPVTSIDAAVTWSADDSVLFFAENNYWKYKRKQRNIGPFRKISDRWGGLPGRVGAATRSRRWPNSTYFIYDNNVYLVEDG